MIKLNVIPVIHALINKPLFGGGLNPRAGPIQV